MTWLTCPSQYLGVGVSVIHVLPLNDLREHQEDVACWCKPKPDAEDERVIVHNAADGRESFERGERGYS